MNFNCFVISHFHKSGPKKKEKEKKNPLRNLIKLWLTEKEKVLLD